MKPLQAAPARAAQIQASPKPLQPVAPPPPPKPAKPPFDWAKARQTVIDAAVSGALMRGLLYLGAFMFVVSVAVLVISFWNNFNFVIQLLFISSVPAAFYAGGWLLRSKLHLEQAGTALIGIGELLIAVDFAAIYQLGNLAQGGSGALYWLVVAVVCTIFYAFTAWKLPRQFFHHITLLGGAGIILALTRVLSLPPIWSVTSVTASAAAMIAIAVWPRVNKAKNLAEFALAVRILPQVLLPLSLIIVLFAARPIYLAGACAFLLASIAYGLLAWRFPAWYQAAAAVLALPVALIFGLLTLNIDLVWYPTAAGLLALVYLLAAHRLKPTAVNPVYKTYPQLINLAGMALVGLTVAGGLIDANFNIWASVVALSLVSGLLVLCAYLFAYPVLVWAASGLFLLPFTLAANNLLSASQLSQPAGWLIVSWLVLALVYLGAAAVLRRAVPYIRWLFVTSHIMTVLCFIAASVALAIGLEPLSITIAWTLCLMVYLLSAVLHDTGQHPALSNWLKWLPSQLITGAFLWPAGVLFPILTISAWKLFNLNFTWYGPAASLTGLLYIAAGQFLHRRKTAYRLPLHVLTYPLLILGISTSILTPIPLICALIMAVTGLVALSVLHQRRIETGVAAVLLIWPVGVILQQINIHPGAYCMIFTLIAGPLYTLIGVLLRKYASRPGIKIQADPLFWVSNGLIAVVVASQIILAISTPASYLPWAATLATLMTTGLLVFNTYYFRKSGFGWASSLAAALTFGYGLSTLQISAIFISLCWAGLALVYLFVERGLHAAQSAQANQTRLAWTKAFRWPLNTGIILLSALGFSLTLADFSTSAIWPNQIPAATNIFLPGILAQVLVAVIAILAAWLNRSRLPLFIEPYLAFFPVTFFFLVYSAQLFGAPLWLPQYGLIWSILGLAHAIAAAVLDRKPIRYAHGLYLGAALLTSGALLFAALQVYEFTWALGIWVAITTACAVLVHKKRMQTWEDLLSVFFGRTENDFRTLTRNVFLWGTAWVFPLWGVSLLYNLNVVRSYLLLALAVPALGYLVLTLWLKRLHPSYSLPFHLAGQVYSLISLAFGAAVSSRFILGQWHSSTDMIELPGFVITQTVVVLFYITAAWINQSRVFAHAAAWLSWVPYTLALILLAPNSASVDFALYWLALAAAALLAGFALDKLKVRFSQAPYLFGYTLAVFSLIWSVSDRVTNIFSLAAAILLAVSSHVLIQRNRHHAFEDFVNFFLRRADQSIKRVAATIFLFFAAYALPVLITQIQAYYSVPLAWRGVGLALAAPLYVACGLWLRKARAQGALQPYFTWPLYSMGYLLTAIGAMITFQDERLAIYVLALDALVYAVSAYIFREAFWLYLSNSLTAVIVLVVLHYNNQLNLANTAWAFTALSAVYLGAASWFNRRKIHSGETIAQFAAPFYHLAFLSMPVALAAATSEKNLTILIFSIGVGLYSLMAWQWKETMLVYPAVWLAAVPYYLLVTSTSLDEKWYGLAWLPLIIGCLAVGRMVFHRQPIPSLRSSWFAWLEHPSAPFYLLAYPLSLSMIVQSSRDPLAICLAFAAASSLYAISAFVFHQPLWLYPALAGANFTLLTALGITPSDKPFYNASVPFLGLNWLIALLGLWADRRTNPSQPGDESLLSRLLGHAWSRPFFGFTVLGILIWQGVAFQNPGVTTIVASGHALLLALFALVWLQSPLTYGVYLFALLGFGAWLGQQGIKLPTGLYIFGGIGFGMYLLALMTEKQVEGIKPLKIWVNSLFTSGLLLSTFTLVFNLFFIFSETTAVAVSLGFAGAQYVSAAYRSKRYQLSYLGLALMEIAWVLLLITFDIRQPQWYAIPTGLYFSLIGFFERRQARAKIGVALELFGFAVLLVTSFIQSINVRDDYQIIYFVLLLVEGLALIILGVLQRRKLPFAIGLGASVVNVLAQIVVLVIVFKISTWFVALGVGALFILIAILVELKREQIKIRSREWIDTLDHWS